MGSLRAVKGFNIPHDLSCSRLAGGEREVLQAGIQVMLHEPVLDPVKCLLRLVKLAQYVWAGGLALQQADNFVEVTAQPAELNSRVDPADGSTFGH
jgi:hypothetical protein